MGDANNQDTAGAHALYPPTMKVILYYFFYQINNYDFYHSFTISNLINTDN
jgi:hypothetical protein